MRKRKETAPSTYHVHLKLFIRDDRHTNASRKFVLSYRWYRCNAHGKVERRANWVTRIKNKATVTI